MGANDRLFPIITEDEFMLGQRLSRLEDMIRRHSEHMETRIRKLEKSLAKIQAALTATGDASVLAALADDSAELVVAGFSNFNVTQNLKIQILHFRRQPKKPKLETAQTATEEMKQD